MREIKFRAWDKDRKEMLSNEWIQTLDLKIDGSWAVYLGGGLKQVSRGDVYAQEHFKRDNIELMQYTGLKDKNDKEIYEGDICHHAGLDCDVIWQEGELRYRLLRHGHQQVESEPLTWSNHMQVEVIGNIYENKELIE